MKIILFGPQGCGKGTIGELLGTKLKLPVLSVGALLRSLDPAAPHSKEIHDVMNTGELAPNHLVANVLKHELDKSKYSIGYVLDGWCRQLSDIQQFDPKPDLVVLLNISWDTSIKRVSGRRICSIDGKTYNIYTLPPEELKKCEGSLTQREDDTEKAVAERLEIYYSRTQKVIDFYKKQGIVVEIDAEPTPDVVFKNLTDALKIS